MAKVIISQLNPVNFINMDRVNLAKYFSYHIDDYLHRVRLNEYQQGILQPFTQVWNTNDALRMQVITDAGQPTIYLTDCKGVAITSFTMDEIRQNEEDLTYYLYEKAYSLTTVPSGIFYVKVTAGQLTLLSEPMLMTSDSSGSLLIEYKHRSFYQNMLFETGFYSQIRLNGLLRFKEAASKNTMFEDQILDMVMLKSKPYRIFELVVGIKNPITDFFIDKLNRIFGCSSIMIDGKYYQKNLEAKWEEVESVANGAMKIYSIELREMTNKTSKVFDTEPEQITGIFTPEFTFEFQ